MHGIGNDFVVLDTIGSSLPDDSDFVHAAKNFCARHFGIGADGLLTVEKSTLADVRMRMWNPDGTEDMCGNGLRCVALLAHERRYVDESKFTLETLGGVRECEVLSDGQIRVQMGEPNYEFAAIPFEPKQSIAIGEEYSLPIDNCEVPHVLTLSTGTAHTVIFVDELPDDQTFLALSPLIENHPWFPERTTVLWTRVLSPERATIRIWERGVGETLACGTGACAVAVASQINGRGAEHFEVESKGGRLSIAWQKGKTIWMTGPAKIVFEGTLHAGH